MTKNRIADLVHCSNVMPNGQRFIANAMDSAWNLSKTLFWQAISEGRPLRRPWLFARVVSSLHKGLLGF